MKFDQDLCKNLCYELNPWVCCAFGNVYFKHDFKSAKYVKQNSKNKKEIKTRKLLSAQPPGPWGSASLNIIKIYSLGL